MHRATDVDHPAPGVGDVDVRHGLVGVLVSEPIQARPCICTMPVSSGGGQRAIRN